MPTRAQKIRLAVFTIIGLIVFSAFVLMLVSEKYLKKRDVYYIAYENVSVSGLEIGSPVKYLGINVGSIEDIRIDPHNTNRIIVKIGLEPGTPIKQDTRADIVAVGITGLKTIELRGGSPDAPLLKPGSYIVAGSSMAEEITGKAEVIAEKLELILNNLQQFTRPENLNKITQLVENTNIAVQQVTRLLDDNSRNLTVTMAHAASVAQQADSLTRVLLVTSRQISQVLAGDTLKEILGNTREFTRRIKEADLANLIVNLGKLVDQTNRLLSDIDVNLERSSEDFIIAVRNLRSALENLNEVSRMVQEDPSILIRGSSVKNSPDQLLEK